MKLKLIKDKRKKQLWQLSSREYRYSIDLLVGEYSMVYKVMSIRCLYSQVNLTPAFGISDPHRRLVIS